MKKAITDTQSIPESPLRKNRYRKELVVFLCVIGFTLTSISRDLAYPNRGNELARIATTCAIVESGTFVIDSYRDLTADWSLSGGHYYSNKAPIPALLATPFYFVQYHLKTFLGLPTGTLEARNEAMQVAKFFTTTLPTLLALALLFYVLLNRFHLAPLTALAVCSAWAVGSLSLVYSVMFFGHQTAAAFLAIAVCATILELDRRTPRFRVIFLAGTAAGISVGSDYIAAIPVMVWTIWLLWRTASLTGRQAIRGAWILGGAGPALVLMAYHYACFGSPFKTPYALDVMNPQFIPLNVLTPFDPGRLYQITLSPWRGFFFANPVWILSFLGLANLIWRRKFAADAEILAAAVAWIATWGYLTLLPGSFGGWCIGPRYIVAILPLAAFLLIAPARTMPRAFFLLLQISAIMMLLVALVDPLPDERMMNPWTQRLIPFLLSNSPLGQKNLFMQIPGVSLLQAMIGYLTVWAIAGCWLAKRLSPEKPTQ